jgi:hypothetical protein
MAYTERVKLKGYIWSANILVGVQDFMLVLNERCGRFESL